jgi:nucleoside-diphosphate-sugar epimerase
MGRKEAACRGATAMVVMVGDVVGSPVIVDQQAAQPGDIARNGGAIERAQRLLDWKPQVGLREGIRQQIEWHRNRAA